MDLCDLKSAIDEIQLRCPAGVTPADVDQLKLSKLAEKILKNYEADIAPYFPLQQRELTLSIAFSQILAFERSRSDCRKVYASYLFAVYVLRNFEVGECFL